MKTNVCAVTVAYNNPQDLNRLLSSLSGQSSILTGLVIVDNSDDCNARENKQILDIQSKNYACVHYARVKNNQGSAGGFYRGMKIAHENDFNWVWLLDQDGTVLDSCLEKLLRYSDEGDILRPKVLDIAQPDVILNAWAVKRNLFGQLCSIASNAGSARIHAFGTHAVLISRKVLDIIGYYDACHYFVGLEDWDYAYKALQAGFAILYVPEAQAMHPSLPGIPRNEAIRNRAFEGRRMVMNGPPKKIDGQRGPNSYSTIRWLFDRYFGRHLPAHLGYIYKRDDREQLCERNRSLATFSHLYFCTRSLTSWQFAWAFVYSFCSGLFSRFAMRNQIWMAKTLKAWTKCFTSNVRKEWLYGCVEEFCQDIMR